MDPTQLHDLVHRDAVAAWPHIVELIESGSTDEDTLTLLEDAVYSDQLPQLIDQIEHRARHSKQFRLALLRCGDALGGKGGPEMDRIFELVRAAEDEFAKVFWFDDARELRSWKAFWRRLPATLKGKAVIYKRRPTRRDET